MSRKYGDETSIAVDLEHVATKRLARLGKSPSMGGDGDFKSPCGDLEGDFILRVCKAYHFSDIDSDRHHVLGLLQAKYGYIAFPSPEYVTSHNSLHVDSRVRDN